MRDFPHGQIQVIVSSVITAISCSLFVIPLYSLLSGNNFSMYLHQAETPDRKKIKCDYRVREEQTTAKGHRSCFGDVANSQGTALHLDDPFSTCLGQDATHIHELKASIWLPHPSWKSKIFFVLRDDGTM